ncbi:mucin-17-like [Argopecten irradians]|uniref:mucin-17-like n=1 Tax=Argopecten irradians TaxID=31199 RepID=UPI00371C54FD
MRNFVLISIVILSLVYFIQCRHVGEKQQTTTQTNRVITPRRSSSSSLRRSSTSSRTQPLQNSARGRSQASKRIIRPNRSNLKSARQINHSPRRVRMNTNSLQGQKSINIRQTSGRPLVQNSQRGAHIIPPIVQRGQGRQLTRSSAVSRSSTGPLVSNRNVRIPDTRSTINGIGAARGQVARGGHQQAALLERGQLSSHVQNQLGRRVQTQRIPSKTGTTRVAQNQGSIIRNSNSMIRPISNPGSLRSNNMLHGQSRGEFKQGATNQIRIRTQADTSKLPFNNVERNTPIIRENTGRGMWKTVPVESGSIPLEKLKSQTLPIQGQPVVINSQPLVSQGQMPLNLANSKNHMVTIQSAPNVITSNAAGSFVGNASPVVVAGGGIQTTAGQGQNSKGLIALELNLGTTKTKQAAAINTVLPSTGVIATSNTNAPSTGVQISPSSHGVPLGTQKAPVQSLQIQQVHSGLTHGGKKKMSLTLSSGQAGGQPIVIEALGNIVLSQEKLPDGRVQFVIKADGPTTGPTVVTTTAKKTTPKAVVTTATTMVTDALTTTTAMPTPTSTLPTTSTIFMEETEMPEPGEFTYPPSGLGTTEPM